MNLDHKYFEIKYNDDIVGYVNLRPETKTLAKTGFYVEAEYRNKGLCTKALFDLIKFAWDAGYKTLITGVHEDNVASQLVLFKNGFRVDYQDAQPDGVMYQVRLKKDWSNNKDVWKGQRPYAPE